MRPNELRNVKGPVSVHLIMLIALAALAVTLVGCRNNATNKDGVRTETGPTPSPSPSPTGSPGESEVPGDTIIVIKDGTVRIKVKKQELRCVDEDDTEHKKYKCDVVLGDMGIQTTDGPTCWALTPTSTVTINEGDKEIEVKGHTNHVKIKFKKAREHYPLCDATVPDEFCGENQVDKIKRDNLLVKDCEPGHKCEVWIRTKPRQ